MNKARTDHNQKRIVEALRRVGATVFSLHKVGQGCPDLLVGYRGRNLLIEVKNSDQVKSKRKLTPDEKQFHESWRGQVAIVETVDEALMVLNNSHVVFTNRNIPIAI